MFKSVLIFKRIEFYAKTLKIGNYVIYLYD